MNLLFLLALLPFLIFLSLLLWRRIPLIQVSLITLILTLIISFFYWRMDVVFLSASIIKGFLVALDIFFILFGALFFLEVLKSLNVIQNICYHLESVSKDHRVQVIFLAWLFENFLEGTAGFGTPSMVIVPLLVGIGLSPISAVIISLLGNSTAGVFGAAGTPIRIGLSDLATSTLPLKAALLNSVGFIVPVFMLWILVAKEKDAKQQFLEGFPFAIWAGITFVLSSLLTVFLGQEFPSILGALMAIFLVFLTTKLKIFIPKNVADPHPAKLPEKRISIIKALAPYLLLIVFLVLGKLLLSTISLPLPLVIKHSVSLFNPGFAFLIVGIPLAIFGNHQKKSLLSAAKTTLTRVSEPFLVIALMSSFVQLMINSSHNFSGFPSLLQILASNLQNMLLPFWAPFIGAFGSFLTGSVTISNLMFGNFLSLAAQGLNLDVSLILALAIVGAAAGNMIALADIVAAETTVGLKNQERMVLKGVIIPCLTIVLITGIVGLVIFQIF